MFIRMEYAFILEIVKKILKTDLLYIFYSKGGFHNQVFPHSTNKEPIPNVCSRECAHHINWIPIDQWPDCPMSGCILDDFSSFAGVICIPFSNNFILVPVTAHPGEDILVLIKEALEIHVREMNLVFELERKEHREKTLFELHQRLVGKIAFEDLLNEMLLFIKDSLGYHNCAILLYEEDGEHLKIVASINYPHEVVEAFRITSRDGITGYAALHNEIVIVEDVLDDPRYIRSSQATRSEMAIPLRVHGSVIGVLDVESDRPGFFSENDRLILEPFAHILAVAIENAKLYRTLEERNEELKDFFFHTVETLAEVIEAKDPYTRGHVGRSAYFGELLAGLMELDDAQIEQVKLGCILHDIGKIGVPETILLKGSHLSDDEMVIMRRHPEIGVQILRGISQLEPVIPFILHHHERFDGHGYPKGIGEHEIPLGARIVAIVDAFDAMVSDRPYRSRLPLSHAMKELERESGGQFDPEIANLFLAWLRDRENQDIVTRLSNGEGPAA